MRLTEEDFSAWWREDGHLDGLVPWLEAPATRRVNHQAFLRWASVQHGLIEDPDESERFTAMLHELLDLEEPRRRRVARELDMPADATWSDLTERRDHGA